MNQARALRIFQTEFLIASLKTGDSSSDEASVARTVKICNAYMAAMAIGLSLGEFEVRAWKLPFSESKDHALLALGIAQMVAQMPGGPVPAVASLRHVFESALSSAPSARNHIVVDWSNAEGYDPLAIVSEALQKAREREEPNLRAGTIRCLRRVGRDFGVLDLDTILSRATAGPGSKDLERPVRLVIEATVRHLAAEHTEEIRLTTGSLMVTSFHVGRLLMRKPEGPRPEDVEDLGRLALLASSLDPAEVFNDSTVEPLYVEFLLRSVESDYPLSELDRETRHSLIKTAAWRGLLLAVAECDLTQPAHAESDPRPAPTRPVEGASLRTDSVPSEVAQAQEGLLVNCAACGNRVSRIAGACPKCGHPVEAGITSQEESKSQVGPHASPLGPVSEAEREPSSEPVDTPVAVPAPSAGGGWYTISLVAAVLAALVGAGFGGVAWAAVVIGVLALANRPRPHRRRWMASAAVVAGVLFALANAANHGHLDGLLASSFDQGTTSSAASAVPASTDAPPPDDRVLQIGTFLALSGEAEEIGRAQLAGVRMAVDDINLAGGVLSQPVELIEGSDGSAPTPSTRRVVAGLAEHVDVLVGPTDSRVAEEILPLRDSLWDVLDTPVVLFSPSNTSPGLNDLDPGNYYFRASPDLGDVARVIAGQIALTHRGLYSVGVLASNDEFGREGAIQFQRRIVSLGGQFAGIALYPTRGDQGAVQRAAAEIAAAGPDVIAVITADSTPSLLSALAESGLVPGSGTELWVTGMVDDSTAMSDLPDPHVFSGMNVVLPLSDPLSLDVEFRERLDQHSDRPLQANFYAAEAYDIVVIAALAAERADSTNPSDLADGIVAVTNGDRSCSTFGSCLDILRSGHAIDYQGLAAPYNFDAVGDPTMVQWAIYEYEAGQVVNLPDVRFVLTDGSPYNRR